jgi:low affinity Fe/Cu permease
VALGNWSQVSRTAPHREPSEVDARRNWFDELAAQAYDVTSRNLFFVAMVILTLVWALSYFLFDSVTHWYITLVIPVEIITLLLVALIENHNRRSEQAVHRKLDAFAEVLAAMASESSSAEVRENAAELRAAVGLQDRESTDDD